MKKSLTLILLLISVFAFSSLTITQTNVVKKRTYNFFHEYDAFNDVSTEWAVIPGLKEKLVPQGISYIPEQNWFILSYYLGNGDPSVLTILDGTTGEQIKSLDIFNQDGTPYKGHAGGVAVSASNIWISSDSYLRRIPINNITVAVDGSEVKIVDEFNTGTRASFATYSNGILWAGEFYHAGNYETNSEHYMTTTDGKKNHSWMVGYKLDSSNDNLPLDKNIEENTLVTPDYILSTPDIVQGVAFLDDGRIALSKSYGRNNDSTIQIYKAIMKEENHTTAVVNGVEVPVWLLDTNSIEFELLALPMSEGLIEKDGFLYVLFESAASKYLNTGKYPTDYIWRTDISLLK